MKVKLSLAQGLKQELKLSQVIGFANLLKVPDQVLNLVVEKVSSDPDSVEAALKSKRKGEKRDAQGKIHALYSYFTPPKGDSRAKGIISSPDISGLEDFLSIDEARITPDVTFVGKRNDKPEIVYSDHIVGSISLYMRIEITPSKYPETSKLLKELTRFDDWKRQTLRDTYVILGDVQREFFEDLDACRFSVFSQQDLAHKMDLAQSTVSRILCNRWIDARNIAGEQRIMYSKDLCVTADDLKKYSCLPLLNQVLEEEFEIGKAFSDQKIARKVPQLARRTITKYRKLSDIPITSERNKLYSTGKRTEPYQFV